MCLFDQTVCYESLKRPCSISCANFTTSKMYRQRKKHKPVHEIFNNEVCASSKASDQSAYTRSLISAFACP